MPCSTLFMDFFLSVVLVHLYWWHVECLSGFPSIIECLWCLIFIFWKIWKSFA
jgi:hypothetical protein